MIIQLEDIIQKFNLKIKGIIHIGAGSGAELRKYAKQNISNFLMIEPDPRNYYKLFLRKVFFSFFFDKNIHTENVIISDVSKNKFKFNLMNIPDCNSILDLKLHKKFYPQIRQQKKKFLKSYTLDSLFEKKYEISNYNFINIDIQGAELLAFNGAKKILHRIDAIYTEVNFSELYKNCCLVDDVDNFLTKFKFRRVMTMKDKSDQWGDALYLKIK